MFILFEIVAYYGGEGSAQLCGTYNTFEDAHATMYRLYHDELSSDERYDEDWCEVTDTFATVGGEDGFPRIMSWLIFDSDNPEQLRW